jgi:large subunit ribosomal protein L29e
MAKSKNHTNHNQSHKNHRNGIKKAPGLHLYMKQRGTWQPLIKNTRKVRKANQAKAIAVRKDKINKAKASFGKK